MDYSNTTDTIAEAINVNDNSHLSTFGLVETLVLSMIAFSILMAVFESNRFYKQIYLKRLQNRFRKNNRVPPYPAEFTFGWFFEIQKITEGDFLKMVGLDAYMCLRFIVICYKLSLFLSFWGLFVLIPLYASANDNERWDRYSISNLISEDTPEVYKYRLWIPTLMGYMFAAYFCQLLYAEYNNFSVRRLQYLVQVNPQEENLDPDTPPQKYFTVMIERIPPHLRSAAALHKFFDKLFPSDVYCVEIALDIEDLDAINRKRKRIRAKLERAIAHYEAKNERMQIYARTGQINKELEADLQNGIFGDDGVIEFMYKSFAPERYGYEKVDALNYYTNKLIKFNQDVKLLQRKYHDQATQYDETMQRKLRNRYDTRVAAMLENITYHSAKTLHGLSSLSTKNNNMSTMNGNSGNANNGEYSSVSTVDPETSLPLPQPFLPPVPLPLPSQLPQSQQPQPTMFIPTVVTRRPSFANNNNYSEPSTAATTAVTNPLHTNTNTNNTNMVINTPERPTPHAPQQQQQQQQQQQHDHDYYEHTNTPHHHQPPTPSGLFKSPSITYRARKLLHDFSIENLLFGPPTDNIKSAYEEQMKSLEESIVIASEDLPPPSSSDSSPHRLHPYALPNHPDTTTTTTTNNTNSNSSGIAQLADGQHQSSSSSPHPPINIALDSSGHIPFPRTTNNNSNNNSNSNTRPPRPSLTNRNATIIGNNITMDNNSSHHSYTNTNTNTNNSHHNNSHHGNNSSNSSHNEPYYSSHGNNNNALPPPTASTGGTTLDSLFEDDHTFQEWIKKSSTHHNDNNNKEEQELTRKRAGSITHHNPPPINSNSSSHSHHYPTREELWRRESELEMKAYLEQSEPHFNNNNNQQQSGMNSFVVGNNPLSRKYPSNNSLHGMSGGGGSAKNSTHGQPPPYIPSYMHDNNYNTNYATTTSDHNYNNTNNNNNYTNTTFGQHVDLSDHNQTYHSPPPPGTYHPRPSWTSNNSNNNMNNNNPGVNMTQSGGISTVLPLNLLDSDQLNELTKLSIERARLASHEGWMQTKLAGFGALRGIGELERLIEYLTIGAYVKYSSTAFVTFNSRVTESIAQQMLLSLDTMEINHAPNPKDIIWENVAIPKSQVVMRNYITNIGIIVGSIFWSSLVNSVNVFASFFPLPKTQQQSMSAIVMLVFLMILPVIFDALARNYEGMKLESEIQNSIMTRYFYYQLINVCVTAGFSGNNLWRQILDVLNEPKLLIDILGGNLPNVSMFFTNLMIVKIFTAIPLEMMRPYQLSTIHMMTNCMNRRTTTRRDLRTGVFYSWPMLYGWIYPQLMMVLMIMVTYACITPIMMPFCVLFFSAAYIMYKYQLLYVYINEDQSGGYMWYAVFNRSLIALQFASIGLLGYLALQLDNGELAAPFYFTIPLPIAIMYFGKYCEHKFKKASENLSYGFARELDHRNDEYRTQNKPTPHDTFSTTCYRQPSLTEVEVFPEPYRNDGTYDIIRNATTGESIVLHDFRNARYNRLGSLSINVHELTDEGEEDQRVLEEYFHEVVLPLSEMPKEEEGGGGGGGGVGSNFDEEGLPIHTRVRR